jgi:hypothetical protein
MVAAGFAASGNQNTGSGACGAHFNSFAPATEENT